MIIPLMPKSVYCFVIFLSCMCNLNYAFSKESIPVHLNYKGKYSSDIKNYEIVVPQRVNKDGSFISHLVSHHHSKRSTKELEFIFYKIPIEGKDYLIELTPNRKLISPGAVVEIHREDIRKGNRFANESSNNETIGKMFENLDIRKLENTECHFSGHVKGENISKAALSTCYGLAGFIQITNGFYTIEPVAEHDPFVEDAYPHILYKTDGLENSSVCHTMGELTASVVDQVVRKRRDSNFDTLPMYVETLVVMDKTLLDHHRSSDCENYVLTVFNMAFNLFHDASLGLMMTLTIVRMIRLEIETDEMNLRVDADAEKSLRYFQSWQYDINPGDDSHPNHHDLAMLLTRVDVCYSPSSCGLLGVTTIGKACDPKQSAALCEDSGLRLGYVIAHEIGHLLGADHDSMNSTCNGTDSEGIKTIMNSHVSLGAQTWSSCSQAYFKAFFRSGMGSCFLDEPEEHHFNVQDLLPGVMYNADFQCKHLISSKARECDMGNQNCNSLNCYVPGYACIVTHTPPADGTACGENMWCRESKCLVVGERPGAIDGNWGEWSAWSDCSRTCGSGVTSSVRNCDKPLPSHGGKNCLGERKRYKICAASPCETGRPSFRDIQCGEFDDWIYPEDGKIHTWKAFYFHDDNPCTLYCISDDKQVAALRPRVVDGTMCYRGIRDICIGGICKSLPCDLHFESNAIEDACGVCHGDGTGCEFSEGTETYSKAVKGLAKIVNVPSGTRNIKVELVTPAKAKLIVKDKDTRDVYVKGKTLGMFNVPGSQAWLGMIKKNQEALNIPGPVSKPLTIWIQGMDDVSVKWSMALPAEQQRKPEFAWDFLKWEPCSAKCGVGTQKSQPSCMEEKSGLVEDSFCADLEMPPVKVRQCEVTTCETRWMVGDWKDCDQPGTEKKERKRVVFCIKSVGEGEGESEIVSDSECSDPKPHSTEPCEVRKKREDTEYNLSDGFFENDSSFKSDTSEFGFHKKYEDYLKHFAALSVPQRNCETIPLYLVSSPHFKHYFHVLETPEGSDTDLDYVADLSSFNGTPPYTQTQNKVSPDFYKETFSGHQIDVSHVQSVSSEGPTTLESRTKKSVSLDAEKSEATTVEYHSERRKLCKRSKPQNQNGALISQKSFSYKPSQKQDKLWKTHEKRNLKQKLFHLHGSDKKFNYTSQNLTELFASLRSNDKLKYVQLLNKRRIGELNSLERTKLRSYQWNAYNPKIPSLRVSKLFSNFLKHKSDLIERSPISSPSQIELRKANNEYDGSGLRKLFSGDSNHQERDDFRKWEGRASFMNPFDPMCYGKIGKKGFKDRHTTFDTFFRDVRLKRNRNVFLMKTKNTASPRNSRLNFQSKRKRSSRKWKRPKVIKESNGIAAGTETKNYLNNLFQNAHQKGVTNKPPEMSAQLEKPVIREGVVVIDRDSEDDLQMDVMFQEVEGEKHQKYSRLPQPTGNKKQLAINGKDVFNFLRELQRYDREALYKLNGSDVTEKVEINVKIPEKGEKKLKHEPSGSASHKKSPEADVTSSTTKATTTATAAAKLKNVTKISMNDSDSQYKSSGIKTTTQTLKLDKTDKIEKSEEAEENAEKEDKEENTEKTEKDENAEEENEEKTGSPSTDKEEGSSTCEPGTPLEEETFGTQEAKSEDEDDTEYYDQEEDDEPKKKEKKKKKKNKKKKKKKKNKNQDETDEDSHENRSDTSVAKSELHRRRRNKEHHSGL